MTAATITLNPGTGGAQMLSDTLTTVDGVAAPASSQAQVMKMAHGAQNTATLVTDTTPLPTSNNATVFRFSTNNTSVVQLAAAATFTGTIETALDQPSISLLMASDQPMTLTVRQFIDAGGTRAAPDIVFTVDAGAGFSRSFTLNGNFVQVLARNDGAGATTTFSLNTAYGDLGDADATGTMPITELPLVLTGQAAQTALVNNVLTTTAGANALNVSGYRAASVQVVSTGTAGAFIFEQSNDGANWVPLPVFNAALLTGVPITAAITASASAIVYSFPIRCTFLRLRISTAITGGSIRAFSRISPESWTTPVQLVASNTAANLNVTVGGTAAVSLATNTPTLAAGTNLAGDVGLQVRANATGAASTSHLVSAATTNAANVKASAGRLLGWSAVNTTGVFQYVKLHNTAGAPTAGAGVVQTIAVPPNSVNNCPPTLPGIAFTTGIGRSIVTGSADADATATTAGSVVLDLFFA